MKKLSILLLLALSLTTVTSCGKEKDTGVIINAGDNSSDDSKDSNLISSDEVKTETDTTSSSTTTGGKAVKKEVEATLNGVLRSSWVADDDTIYEFNKDGTIAGIDSKTGANLTGTWESDFKDSIEIKLTNRYELKDGNVVNLKDKTIKWKVVEHSFYYKNPPMTMVVNVGKEDTKLEWRHFLEPSKKEEDYVTYTVGPENPEDYTEEELHELEEQYEEARKDKSDEATNPYTGMTRAEAKEKGLDWDTGTPLVNQEE